MEILLAVIVLIGALSIIFLMLRCNSYKKGYEFYVRTTKRIVEGDAYKEALAIMGAVYHLEEDEIVRRLSRES